jgi:ABC-2 type transport system ATP-binding protein
MPPFPPHEREPVIEARELTCRFGPTVAVDRLTLDVRAGEIFAVLGHNGAGKTTMVRLLNGVLRANSGTARVLGLSPISDGSAVRRRTGVLTETPALDERLTARENLAYAAAFYDVPRHRTDERVNELLRAFELHDRAEERVGGYSKGMKQRLALARLLMHDPELLFLDEPTAGLDPVAARQLHELIRQSARARGRTVFLCTHNLAEAEQLCDRVAVLAQGRLVALGTPEELSRRFAPTREVRIEVDVARTHEAIALLGARFGAAPFVNGAGELVAPRMGRERIPELVHALASAGIRIYRVEPREATLEDVYFAIQDAGIGARLA